MLKNLEGCSVSVLQQKVAGAVLKRFGWKEFNAGLMFTAGGMVQGWA